MLVKAFSKFIWQCICVMQALSCVSHPSQSCTAKEHRHKGSWETSGLDDTEANLKGEDRAVKRKHGKVCDS